MLIDIFIVGIGIITAIDLLKLFVEQIAPHYAPKHGRRRSV